MGLCSKCFRQLETSAQQIPESRVVEHLLRQAGYKSMDHARKTLLFRELYPDVSSGSEAENLPGRSRCLIAADVGDSSILCQIAFCAAVLLSQLHCDADDCM
eukprot:TRINITY_DN9602_c0_g1_i2.p1 TRINITY_DN9602_c0_g1~~TRINITY_DN9602_c0_g1_i2.p1  ORF type:complete len:102 (+),score=1.44 TRINITY_DN9602_c0_g1_i2:77-382(+)